MRGTIWLRRVPYGNHGSKGVLMALKQHADAFFIGMHGKGMLVATILALLALHSQGASCPPQNISYFIQYQTTWGDWSKCGFDALTNDLPPRQFKYHVQTSQESYGLNWDHSFSSDANSNILKSCGSSQTQITVGPGSVTDTHNESRNATLIETMPGATCRPSTYVFTSGSYSLQTEVHDTRPEILGYQCDGITSACKTDQYGTDDISASPALVSGSWEWSGSRHFTGDSAGCHYFDNYTYDTTEDWYFDIAIPSFSGVEVYVHREEAQYTLSGASDEPHGTYTISVDSEFTDEELRGDIMTRMPDYDGIWYTPDGNPYEIFMTSAYSVIDGTHTGTGDCWWPPAGQAELQKMKYHFGISNPSPGTPYHVSWDVVTWDTTTGQVDVQHKSTDVSGIDPVLFTADQEEMPPYWDPSLEACGGWVITFLNNVSVSTMANDPRLPPGSGPIPAIDSSGCSSCVGPNQGLVNQKQWGGISGEFTMGQTVKGYSAGSLAIWSPSQSVTLATPASLSYSGSNEFIEIITNSSGIRQVKAPQVLADVITNDAFSYDIRYFLSSQVGSKVNGIYQLSGNPTPFVSYRVQNPDASTNVFNRVRVIETRGADSKTYDWTYTAAASTWKLDHPSGLREDEWSVSTVTNGTSVFLDGYIMPGYLRTVTQATRVPGGPDQLKTKRVYQMFTWGEALVQETLDPDNNPKTTSYTYYPDSLFQHGAPVQKIINPDGSWQWFTYDGSGRPSVVYSSYGDIAASGSSPPTGAREIHYFYGDYAFTYVGSSGDDGTIEPDVPRYVSEYRGGTQVSARYTAIVSAGMRIEVQALNLAGNWDDAANLFTTNYYYTSGINQARLKSTVRPDKTFQTFNYADDATVSYTTNMTATGQPDTLYTKVIDGATNYSVINSAGQPVISVTKDVASGSVLSQSTWSNFDSFGRPGTVTYLDGTTELTVYACCGVDNTTDRDGVNTQFYYDRAKRQVAQMRLNITTTNILDSAGHSIKTIRIGSDATQTTLSSSGYNVAGQLINDTNGLSGVTRYTEALNNLGGLILTTTYPDGGIRVETNYLDGTIKSFTGTGVHGVRYEYGIETVGATGDSDDDSKPYTKEIKLNTDGSDSGEWTRTYTDYAGRVYKTIYSDSTTGTLADNAYTKSWFNSKGQLWKQRDADEVVNLYAYNAKGELEYTAVDVNRNDTIDYGGLDRITRTTNSVLGAHSTTVRRSESYAFATDNSTTPLLLNVTEDSLDGLQSWQTAYRDASTPVTSFSRTVYAGSGNRYQTNMMPDGSYDVSTHLNGRLISTIRKDSGNAQFSAASYSYDAHGRQSTITDARNGSTVYTYNSGDMVFSVTSPNPGTLGGQPQTTFTYYDSALRTINIVNPDGSRMTNEYFVTGELKKTYGSRTYPVEYTYDYAGRMKTMKTWQNFAGNSGTATTTWNYDAYRGWLNNKRYADSSGPDYTYTPAGRLKTRTWARTGTDGNRIVTTYSYGIDDGNPNNDHGDLVSISYSNDPQTTTGITYTYERRGRQKTVVQGSMTTALAYNDANQLLYEKYTGGTLDGLGMTNAYDTYLRRTAVALSNQTSTLVTYIYDNASRLSAVANGSYNATYSYIANSSLVGQITFKQSSATRMTITKGYDYLNRLTSIGSTTNSSTMPALSYAYAYNDANLRVRCTAADGSFWIYDYDSLGQVKSGKKYWPDWTPVAGQQFEYGHDDTGNRTSTKAGGDQNAASLRSANYLANNLNQYTARDVPGGVDVMGIVLATNSSVTVNTAAPYRKGEYFRQQVSVANTSVPVWQAITVTAQNETTVTGNAFVPKTQELFAYDTDGNLKSDGRWNYTWDAENRLVTMVANTGVGPQSRIDFSYDWRSRRVSKRAWPNTGGTGTLNSDLRFVYDGWNLVATLNATNNAVIQSFVWGTGLSGSHQTAGGVGGLVALIDTVSGVGFAILDGNGNVTGMVKGTDGSIAALYEYGPFGEMIRSTGPLAKVSPVRFSTKYQDDEADLLYYGYRYLSTSAGRWLGRDPIGEDGGYNLYSLVGENPVNDSDALGWCGGGGGGAPLACGVDKLIFSTGKWITPPGVAKLSEVLLIKFLNDSSHDPSACALAARAKVSETLNGEKKIAGSTTGMPYDNQWHTDTMNWNQAADAFLTYPPSQLKGSLYDNMKNDPNTPTVLKSNGWNFNISDWDYVAFDLPGVYNCQNGDQITRTWSQKAVVFDKNTKSIVKEVDAGPVTTFRIVGTYPKLKFKP
jgi:RHS repeat-associated protein